MHRERPNLHLSRTSSKPRGSQGHARTRDIAAEGVVLSDMGAARRWGNLMFCN